MTSSPLSIVVPTYREAANIEPFALAVHRVMQDAALDYELILVDDASDDDIEGRIARLARTLPVRCHVRRAPRRDLAMSVVEGMALARHEVIVVMDADLSHPPEVIPSMLEVLARGEADLVVGSRYVAGGSFEREWNFWRYLNSRVGILLAAPLTGCSDAMSGFFAVRRSALPPLETLRPIGYKILLELLVRGDFRNVVEWPIRFRDRARGESKMNVRQQWNYLRHLRRLYLARFRRRAELVHFLAVGGSGFVIDVGVYYLLQALGLEHRVARALSFWPAVTSNWFWNRRATFAERRRRPRLRQWTEFALACLVGFAVNSGSYAALTTTTAFFDRYRLLALVVGVALGTFFNFALASLYVYSEQRADAEPRARGERTPSGGS